MKAYDYTNEQPSSSRPSWPAIIVAALVGAGLMFLYKDFTLHSLQKEAHITIQAEHATLVSPAITVAGQEQVTTTENPVTSPVPTAKVAETKVETPAVVAAAPVQPAPKTPETAAQGAPEANKAARAETPALAPPPVKPEPATTVVPATPATASVVPAVPPARVVRPARALDPWQVAIIEQNKGLKMATRSPMPLFDPKDFTGVNVEVWRNKTVKDILNWLYYTDSELDRNPDQVLKVVDRLWALDEAHMRCRACTSDYPAEFCKRYNRAKMEEYCDLAADLPALEYKPFQALPRSKSSVKASRK